MSRTLAVFHGHFGRATVYQLNRAFNVHSHREGQLIFHIGGTPGCGLRFGCTKFRRTASLARNVRQAAAMICGAPSLKSLDGELRSLIDACLEESWCQADAAPDGRAGAAVTDFRVRKSIKLLAEGVGAEIELDAIARKAGLSRPHFYKLFRTQTGVTPHLYVNTLLMEKALDSLVTTEASIADIGFDLGVASQTAFTHFFAGNVGMAPTDYRRAAKVLRP
jgi:AraC-like DNA-binding protein